MNILVTNDDCIDAKGINVIFNKLKEYGHSVYMVAPAGNRSAVSSKISMFSSLEMKCTAENKWSCEGSPADCVIIACKSEIFPEKIDMVVSGINAGANLGTDVVYSGTCAAARQAALYKIPGVAVSLDKDYYSQWDDFLYEPLAEFVCKNIEKLHSILVSCNNEGFININGCNQKSYKGAVLCKELSLRDYNDKIKVVPVSVDSSGKGLYLSEFVSSDLKSTEEIDSDFHAVKNGFISVSLIKAEPASLIVEKNYDFVL